MPETRRSILLACMLAVPAVGLVGCHTYHPGWYEGDGVLTAQPTGRAGSSRYTLNLAPIDLLTPKRHTFVLKGLPAEQMQAVLSLNEPSQEKLDVLEKARVRVVMTLIESQSGRTSVKDGQLTADWSTTAESWNGQPVDFTGVWFQAQRHDEYTLVVDVWVEQAVTSAQPISATPRVIGGGFLTH